MSALAIIPAYNEATTVATVVRGLRRNGLTVLVVDDGSSDATGQEARASGATVITLATNIGVGGALRTGFTWAVDHGCKEVVVVDADLQHDPDQALGLLEEARRRNVDLLIGSRFGVGEYRTSWPRRMMMRVLARLVARRVGTELDDVTSGFRVIREPLLSTFAAHYPAEYLGDTVEAILLAAHHGASIDQVRIGMQDRQGGAPTPRLHAAGHLLRLLVVMAVPRKR